MKVVRWLMGLIAVLVITMVETKGTRRQQTRFVPRIHDKGLCPNKKQYVALHYVNITMHEDGFEYVNANITLQSDVKTVSKILVIVHRCSGAVSESQCEYFNTYTWSAGICQGIHMKKVMWTRVVDSVSPRLQCPIKKGQYVLSNGAVNYEQLALLAGPALEKYIWRLELQALDEVGEMALCSFAVGELRRVASKPK